MTYSHRPGLIALFLLAAPLLAGSPSYAQDANGTWTSPAIPPVRDDHAAVFDPVRGRMLVFGGPVATDLWELSAGGTWTKLPVTGSLSISGLSAIYDPLRDRILVFGGTAAQGPYNGGVWQLPLEAPYVWSPIITSGPSPAARTGHTAVYDPSNDRMIVFGGYNGSYLNDAWSLSLSGTPTWSLLTPQGSPPNSREDHSAIFDTARGRMLVFGGAGYTSQSALYNDVWELRLTGTPTWSPVATAGSVPSARSGHCAIYDSANDRMILYNGQDFFQPSPDDLWELSLSGGTPAWGRAPYQPVIPQYRTRGTAVFDSADHRMIVFGGDSFTESGSGPALNDTWQLNLSGALTWSTLEATPEAFSEHTATYDPTHDRMLAFSISNAVSPWSISTSRPTPASSSQEAVYSIGLWELSLSGDPKWNPIALSGTYPFSTGTAVLDPPRNRMLVIGNDGFGMNLAVWQLPLFGAPTWSTIAPSGTPPPQRTEHTAVYDPIGDRVIVFGGFSFGVVADTWALNLSGVPSWTQLSPANAPPPVRYAHSAIYDSARRRMVIFGGDNNSVALSDAWELTLDGGPAWNALAPAGAPPSARYDHTAIYDPVRDRMVVFGGTNGSTSSNDAWELRFSGTPTWSQLSPSGTLPSARSGHTSVYDALRDRMIVWGGAATNEVQFLSWGNLVAAPLAPAAGVRLAGFPNPFRSKLEVRYSIPTAGRASVRIYDSGGRELAVLADGMHRAAEYDKSWDGRDRSGKRVASGIYFIELRTPSGTQTARVAHIE
jgi:hypothetical protein